MKTGNSFACRLAELEDLDRVAEIFSASLDTMLFLPRLYTREEEQWFIHNVIAKECNITVASSGTGIVSFLARQAQEIRLLHTDPHFFSQGAGGALVQNAKAQQPRLELWCFQANRLARKFYEAQGFEVAMVTDGQRNEEKLPDMLYRWEKP